MIRYSCSLVHTWSGRWFCTICVKAASSSKVLLLFSVSLLGCYFLKEFFFLVEQSFYSFTLLYMVYMQRPNALVFSGWPAFSISSGFMSWCTLFCCQTRRLVRVKRSHSTDKTWPEGVPSPHTLHMFAQIGFLLINTGFFFLPILPPPPLYLYTPAIFLTFNYQNYIFIFFILLPNASYYARIYLS